MTGKKTEFDNIMEILVGLSQGLRCCRQDGAFCEGVTFHQFIILDAVARKKELPMAKLHELLAVQKSTTTRLVGPLLSRGLVDRVAADHDSRAVKLVLTAAGAETHRAVWRCVTDFFRGVMANIPAEKRKETLEAVRTFSQALMKNPGGSCCR
ncbi:MAG: MarR family winged helix-turn-helix transcriptional regulator [Smithellaceae bacterium]|nr:MarR family winged helix-turn-helix transcriptional regulator [Smithellaceae bacterium]